jgi:hypothetical protein
MCPVLAPLGHQALDVLLAVAPTSAAVALWVVVKAREKRVLI